MISGGLAIGMLAAHMVGDYIAQTDWMAKNKMKRIDALLIHVVFYTACFVPVVFMHSPDKYVAVMALCLISIMHALTDWRRWANGDKWPCKPILVDQSIHAIQLWLVVEFIVRSAGAA